MFYRHLIAFFIIGISPAAHAATNLGACRVSFSGLTSADRDNFVHKVKEFPEMRMTSAPSALDLQRRVLQSLFVDTKFFLSADFLKTPPIEFSRPSVENRIRHILIKTWFDLRGDLGNSFRSLTSEQDSEWWPFAQRELTFLVGQEKNRIRFAVRNKLEQKRADEFLTTINDINNSFETTVMGLSTHLQATKGLDEAAAKSHQLRAEILEEEQGNLKAKRFGYLILRRAANVILLPMAGFGGSYLSDVHAPEILTWMIPVTAAIGYNTISEIRARAPIVKAKAIYQRFLSNRGRKGVDRAVSLASPSATSQKQSATDVAFEMGWESWRLSTLQAEAATSKEDAGALGDRLNRMSILLPSLRGIELPDGGDFDSASKEAVTLTPERLRSLGNGYQRRINQLNLLAQNVEWIEHDLSSFKAQLDDPASRPSYADDNYLTMNKQFIESLDESIAAIKNSLGSSRAYFDFVKSRSDAGEHAFKSFVNAALDERRRR